MPSFDPGALTRRDALKAGAGAAVIAGAGAVGVGVLDREENAPTGAVGDEEARALAERFAPVLYFDAREPWLPTDPRPYEVERDGETVVDGFAALDGYHRRYREAGEPPDPTVFYNAVRYENSPLAVVQFWTYSAFDQFTTNFHWHDWEVLHVFVDTETGDPRLFVASSHSRRVPNNEFLDPGRDRPRVLAELGSHSSALSVNEREDSFQRAPVDVAFPDVTNRGIGAIEAVAEVPAAYGLPRDEGFRLPYVVPELDGAPVYEHDRLPNVTREDLVPADAVVRSFDGLARPPADLPARETGRVLAPAGSDAAAGADHTYELVPAADVEHVDAFAGPQLSFEFAVPEFAEDAIASHITTTGVPWGQARYDDPAADISEPAHRAALAERYAAIAPGGPSARLAAAVGRAVPDEDAPEDEGVATAEVGVEAVCLLESDPEAVPTFAGVAVLRDVPPGDHRLTVNAAGVAPYSERVRVPAPTGDGSGPTATGDGTTGTATAAGTGEGTGGSATPTGGDGPTGGTTPAVRATAAGVEGRVTLVANEDAERLRLDAAGTDADLRLFAVEDDFGGRLYETRLDGPDAVYVHRGGAYTAEVVDAEGAVGAVRVNPGRPPADDRVTAGDGRVTVDRPDTGKGSLAAFVAAVAGETSDRTRAAADLDGTGDGPPGGGVRGLATALDAVRESAERARERAAAGDAPGADRRLETVAERLDRVAGALADARGDLPEPVARAVDRRLDQADRRTEQARAAGKL